MPDDERSVSWKEGSLNIIDHAVMNVLYDIIIKYWNGITNKWREKLKESTRNQGKEQCIDGSLYLSWSNYKPDHNYFEGDEPGISEQVSLYQIDV